jgi:hypothetical protein
VLIGELVPHCQINNKVLFFVLIMVQNLNVTTTNVYGGHPITDNARSANNRMVLYQIGDRIINSYPATTSWDRLDAAVKLGSIRLLSWPVIRHVHGSQGFHCLNIIDRHSVLFSHCGCPGGVVRQKLCKNDWCYCFCYWIRTPHLNK